MKHISIGKDVQVSYPIGREINKAVKYIDIVVETVGEQLRKHTMNLWVRGSSGAVLAGIFVKALNSDKRIIVKYVKKTNEDSHFSMPIEEIPDMELNIILDDFVREGSTMDAIYKDAHDNGIRKIDYLIVANFYKSETRLPFRSFVPEILVTDDEAKSMEEIRK